MLIPVQIDLDRFRCATNRLRRSSCFHRGIWCRLHVENDRLTCTRVRACLCNWCTYVLDTRSSKRFCESCCRIRCIHAFEGSRFGCSPSVRARPDNWCTCVLDTRSSKRFCVSCCRIRCIRFEYIRLPIVLIRRTCYTRGICTLLVSVYAQVLCSNWRTRCGRCGAIENHNECRPCGKIIA